MQSVILKNRCWNGIHTLKGLLNHFGDGRSVEKKIESGFHQTNMVCYPTRDPRTSTYLTEFTMVHLICQISKIHLNVAVTFRNV